MSRRRLSPSFRRQAAVASERSKKVNALHQNAIEAVKATGISLYGSLAKAAPDFSPLMFAKCPTASLSPYKEPASPKLPGEDVLYTVENGNVAILAAFTGFFALGFGPLFLASNKKVFALSSGSVKFLDSTSN